jgi:shikimate dehydrogenase
VITGATRVAGVIGDPVDHSLSPLLHNAAYRALGLDWVYVPFHVRAGEASAVLDSMRALDLAGLSVTMPHKTDVASACDELTDTARLLESVNTVTPIGDGRLRGDSTDGEGFMRALADEDIDVAGLSVFVLGAGGAARAVAHALHTKGAQVIISARRSEAAEAVAALVDGVAVGWEARENAQDASDMLVNATPLGMHDDDPEPFANVRAEQIVADIVYRPDRPSAHLGGENMLLQQAALQIEQWTGREAPLDAMRKALRGE